MPTALASLPDNVEALKGLVLSARAESEAARAESEMLRAAKAEADARIDRLTAMLKMLERARYGRRSESRDPEQGAFVFEEVETGLAAADAARQPAERSRGERLPRPRKPFPAHLERVEEVIEPEVAVCVCGSCARVRIGEDVAERLDVVAAKFRVIVTRRPRYACSACRESIVQAPTPARLIEAGIPTEALLAHVAVGKYADGLPLYRQAAIYARDGVDLDRSTLAGWMGRVGFHLQPLADHVLQQIRAGDRIFADETSLPTLAPGTGKTKTAWLWTYARDDRLFGGTGPPMVAYRFEDSRGADCPARHLAGFSGLLQIDGYAAYRPLLQPGRAGGPVTAAACWAHLRRKFYELHVAGLSQTATWTIDRMAPLWLIEKDIRGRSAEIRQATRAKLAVPIVAELFGRWEAELTRIPGRSKLADAIRYGLARRAAFERFLADGRLDIDSNTVERAIRPQTITRKNALFAGSDAGGSTWATIATLLSTAKLNGVDPQAWLTITLERIAKGWPQRHLDALMPWHKPDY